MITMTEDEMFIGIFEGIVYGLLAVSGIVAACLLVFTIVGR